MNSLRLFAALLIPSVLVAAAFAQDKPAGNPLNEPQGDAGVIPVGADGQPLNLNFETGTLAGWKAEGKAWDGQPTKGEISQQPERPFGEGKKSEHTGQFWLGGFEKLRDAPTGTLTSDPFEVTQPFASFLIGGGRHKETRVELVTTDDNKVFFTASGQDQEELRPVIVDLAKVKGQKIAIRIVDQHTGGWGHVNFDDFRFHKARPRFRSPVANSDAPAVTSLYPHAGLSAEEAAREMVVPPGFSVQVAAAEPDVQQPIAMAIDDRGRIWIAEAYAYPTRAPEGEGKDRILILEDTDLDGKFDKRTVFYEGLNLVSGLEVGFGGVWVGAAPYLLFIPDKNGDDVPDAGATAGLPSSGGGIAGRASSGTQNKLAFPKDVPPVASVLLDGWGYEDTHETLNSFIWGPDGWLYGCHGVFTHSKVGKPGTPEEKRIKLNAGIWRYHPVRHEFEVFAHGTSNPWGLDYDQYGNFFATACVIPHIYHIIPGARYERQAGEHFNPYTYNDIKTIADHRHYTGNQWNDDNRRQSDELGGGHAHAGCMIYQGGAWPEKYRGAVFMNNIHGNRLNIDLLEPKGSGFVAHHGPDFLLTRDQWSQMLYLTYGPDGQVWVIDWYDMQQCHLREPNKHDRSNGRIYRIVYDNARPVRVDLQKLSDEELVKLLAHDNEWYRRHAQRILQERAAEKKLSVETNQLLTAMAEDKDDALSLRACWAMESVMPNGGIGGRAMLRTAMKDVTAGDLKGIRDELRVKTREPVNRPRLRAWVSHVFLEMADDISADLRALYADFARDPSSPAVRLAIASGSQHLPPDSRWEIVEALTSHPEDAADHNLPLMYWYAMEPLADVDPARALALGLSAGERIPILKEYMIRKIGAGDPAKSLALLVDGLKNAKDDATRLAFLRGMRESVKGRKEVPMPAGFEPLLKEMAFAPDGSEEVQAHFLSLAVTFGQPAVIKALRDTIGDEKSSLKSRQFAIQVLAEHRDAPAVASIRAALSHAELRKDALRGLAVYDDPQIPAAILAVYAELPTAERRDALTTLSSRVAYARELLSAVAAGKIPANHLTADLVTNLRNLNDEALNKQIEQVWGIVRESPEEKAQLIAHYKALLSATAGSSSNGGGTAGRASSGTPSLELGRAIFAKTCANCHRLFGSGAKIGPDITGSQRANLDYLLTNLIDPSAVMAKEYQPLVVRLGDGRVVTGLKTNENVGTITLQTQNEQVVIPKADIEESKQSEKSLMPDNQLDTMTPHEVQALIAYLSAGGQTPMLATADNVGSFYDGTTLKGWVGDDKLWSVEDGEIVGKTTGLAKNEFLISELSVGNFRLELDVKLVEDKGNSGIQIRSQPIAGGEMKGYQADIGPGWWGKLYEEHGRALLEAKGGEEFVKKGDWNHYEIIAAGSRVRTWINGKLCVDRDDPLGARTGVIAVQLHSGGATEVRFKNLQLTLLPSHVPARPYPTSKPAPEGAKAKVNFKKTTLSRAFRSEGVGMGDFNNDGLLDISAGSVWYENPGPTPAKGVAYPSPLATGEGKWPMHVITEKPNSFDIKTYGDTFMNWAEDLNGDGRQDLIVVDFPGKQTWWFQNSGHASNEPWKRNVVVPQTNDESPLYLDGDGDGQRGLVYGDAANRMSIARPQSDPLQEWKATAISAKGDAEIQKFYHGLGVGDINKDGRNDILAPSGWWEGPETQTAEPWVFHAAPFGPAQAQMYVFDFDGDGDNDVVGSSAHQRGIWWYEQLPENAWKQHLIDDSIAQTHALILADINGDGLPDLVTGKRFYAHNGRDPGEDEPPVLAWFELSREGNAPKWTKHEIDADSGVGTQFEVHDMNADGLLDVIVANKRGVFYFEQVK